jgi:hypothetical protein
LGNGTAHDNAAVSAHQGHRLIRKHLRCRWE